MGDKNHRTPKIRRRWIRNSAEQVIPNRKKKYEEDEKEAIERELNEYETVSCNVCFYTLPVKEKGKICPCCEEGTLI